MKLITTTRHEIHPCIQGVLYHLTETPSEVTDEVAAELHIQFGHLINITDAVSAGTPEVQVEEEIVDSPEEEVKTE